MSEADDRDDEAEGSEPALNDRASSLLRLAKNERPASELEARVLDSLAYRSRLEESAPRPLARRLPLPYVATGLAAAAALALWFSRNPSEEKVEVDHEPIEIGAEPLGTSPALAASSTSNPPKLEVPKPVVFDPCVARVVANGNAPLVDDFEDGDDAVLPNEQREGLWRWVRDTDAPGTAPALLPVPRQNKTSRNQLALHVKGERLREWGATIEFVFGGKCYDASAYAGIAFEARGSTRIYVAPREVKVIPVSEGGLCEADCHNNHILQIELEPRWTKHEVRFEDVEQRGYDRPALDPSRLHSLAFLIRPEDTPYDVWLDNIQFIPR
jgi:hypothetical protein